MLFLLFHIHPAANQGPMIDSPDDPSEQADFAAKERAEHAARVKAASDALGAALKEYAQALREQGWFLGWDKGFTDGWEAASKHFTTAAEASRKSRIPPAPPPQAGVLPLASVGQDAATATEKVYAFIEGNPGLRGVEIAERFAPVMLERTVRTALHRLRDKKIKNVGGRWYTIAAAPGQAVP